MNFKALEPASGPLRAWTTIAMRAGLESPMVNILTGQAEVRPELALAILERKFPQRWAKVTVVAAPPHHLTFNVADILQKVQERIAQGQLPPATIINAPVKAAKPHDPRPPRLTVVSTPAEDTKSKPTDDPGLQAPKGRLLKPRSPG